MPLVLSIGSVDTAWVHIVDTIAVMSTIVDIVGVVGTIDTHEVGHDIYGDGKDDGAVVLR